MKVDGDSLIQLTTEGRNFFPDWGTDGKWMYYTQSICYDGECGIFRMRSSDGSEKDLIALYGRGPSFGLHKDIFVYRKGSWEIHLYSLSSREDSLLILFNDSDRWSVGLPAFHPQKNIIAYSYGKEQRYSQIYLYNLDTQKKSKLTTKGGAYPSWSPDGEWIVYSRIFDCDGRIWKIRANGTEKQTLTPKSKNCED